MDEMNEPKRGDRILVPIPPHPTRLGTIKSVGLDGYLNVKFDDGGTMRVAPWATGVIVTPAS